MVGISWYEATAFCIWAAETVGKRIRLPTEVEWEKGPEVQMVALSLGGKSEPNSELCNFNGEEKKKGKPIPVGQYSPQGDSPFGCMDMAGNVNNGPLTGIKLIQKTL